MRIRKIALIILFTFGIMQASQSQITNISYTTFLLKVDSLAKLYSNDVDTVFVIIQNAPGIEDSALIITKKGEIMKSHLCIYPLKEIEEVKCEISSLMNAYNAISKKCMKTQLFSNMYYIIFKIIVKRETINKNECIVNLDFNLKQSVGIRH